MKRPVISVAAALVLLAPLAALAAPTPSRGHGRSAEGAVHGLTAAVTDTAVHLAWNGRGNPVSVRRDGVVIARVPVGAKRFDDTTAAPQVTHTYQVGTSRPVRVRMPDYLVGAATEDITPAGRVNLGGNGLGDGRLFPDALIGRGGTGSAKTERIKVRATVVDDGRTAIAIADIEVQGWFAAYQDGKQGLSDMAAEIARLVPRLPVANIVIASDHSHSAPDTLGVWGGPKPGYLDLVKRQVVSAVRQAYSSRVYANLAAGHSDASDLVYNQSCSEGLNQDAESDYPNDVCATPGKDGMVRVVQATAPSGRHPLTFMAFAAHATAGGGSGIHGDWPQFLSDAMSARYGGVGLAMVGALGGTQPCRPTCGFTKPTNPGYGVKDRKTAIVLNYSAHVASALAHARRVTGPVAAAQGFIREPLVGPAAAALFAVGKYGGAELMRNHEPPWVNAQTVRTVVGAMRIGNVVLAATPGEAFPRIRQDVADAVGSQAIEVISLGLANDQLGYLIAPAAYVPIIAAEVPVNDNIIFNVSPTIGDHVACADITLLSRLRLAVPPPPSCAPYVVEDSLGDPISAVPVGGIVVP
ncbi:MAG TPA: hypothetical protein VM097_00325 [Mycobacteriales bacterium]|nr:hypothetical protein [Mycobacteriales bacterium]